MKKRAILLLVLILAVVLFVSSCAAMSDWIYKDLPAEYEVWRCNACSIILCKSTGDYTASDVIPYYLKAFCDDGRYIGAKTLNREQGEDESHDSFSAFIHETSTDADCLWYLVDSETDDIFGPYTQEEYEAQLHLFGIDNMGEWINTSPRPKGAQ